MTEKKSTKKIGITENITLEEVVALSPEHVYWLDRNGVYLGCNDRQAKTAGLKSRHDVVGLKNKDLPWNYDAGTLPEELDQTNAEIMRTGIPQILEERGTLEDGTKAMFLSNKTPLFDESGEVKGLLGISVDITERKKMEQELRRAKQLQVQAQNAKIQGMVEIAANIAHEVKTPLVSIQSATYAQKYLDRLIGTYNMATEAGLLVEAIRPNFLESLKTIFQSISSEAEKSMNIIDVFLSNLKSMANESNAEDYQFYSIKKAVAKSLSKYSFSGRQKEIVHFNDSVDFKFYGANVLIHNIISNLMKNALYFIRKKPDAKISIWCEQDEAGDRLHFKDSGEGISKPAQKHVFDFGFSNRKDTTGFGLTYCKTTMQQMGGDIAVRSEPGEYTEFVLIFPKIVE